MTFTALGLSLWAGRSLVSKVTPPLTNVIVHFKPRYENKSVNFFGPGGGLDLDRAKQGRLRSRSFFGFLPYFYKKFN